MGYTYTRALLATSLKSEPAAAPKRGRGRGRGSGTSRGGSRPTAVPKERATRTKDAVPLSESTADPPQTKRGRPKATPRENAAEVAESSSSSKPDTAAPPKKRGRPKAVTQDATEQAEAASLSQPDADSPPKKRRQLAKKAAGAPPTTDSSANAVEKTSVAPPRPAGGMRKTRAKPATVSPSDTATSAKNVNKKKPAAATVASTPLPLFHLPYRLKHAIRRQIVMPEEDEDREHLNIWACEFEPRREAAASTVVALCTENLILFLDVVQGKYIKKYTHPEPLETFYALAWTTLDGPEDFLDSTIENSCSILAAAGRLGSIKLVNPLQNECFRYLFGHQKGVSKLMFSKQRRRWLFSASDDMSVRLWDIGTPTSKTDNSTCLAKFILPSTTGVPTAISLSPDMSRLAVGCETGDMALYDLGPTVLKKLEKSKDAVAFKSHTLYPAGDEWHEGYVDDIHIIDKQSNGLDGCVGKFKLTLRFLSLIEINQSPVSRGASDREILVWNPQKSTKTDADIVMSLMWPDADDIAGVRFKVFERSNQKAVVAGDYEGQIHVFDIGNGRKSKTLEDGTKERFPATKIFSHLLSKAVIRDVSLSDDTRILVAVDSESTVFVWVCA
ncbi:Leucine-rich repeats and WD repeat domain-containing protein 1 [Apophysomyces sp. BC1034]|nr:Leucine-rich repeats and WD repeat domain-containing protein 1 [Apophysomyces sp. BC1034]